jgi:hypothetical protein
VFAAGIWFDGDQYWPVITSWRKDSMDDAFCAIVSAPQEESIDAALIAKSDIEDLIAWAAPPCTSSEVRKLVSKTGYAIRPKLASGAQRTRRCGLALRSAHLRVRRRSRKVMKISSAFATLAMTGSGEIERPVEKSRPTSWLVRRMRC